DLLERHRQATLTRRLGQAIHGLGELDVPFRDPAGIVGGKRHLDLVIDVEPFRMVIELLRDQRRARHEAERFVEIFEREFFDAGVATFDFAPAVKLGERALARAAGQFLCHGDDLCSDCATKAASTATRKHSPNSYLSLKGRPVGPQTQSDAAGGYDVLVAQYRQDRRNGGPRSQPLSLFFWCWLSPRSV